MKNSTRPRAAAASACRDSGLRSDQLSDRAITRLLGRLLYALERRDEQRKGHEGQEPRDVEVEPVRRAISNPIRTAAVSAASWSGDFRGNEPEHDRADQQQPLESRLEDVEIGWPGYSAQFQAEKGESRPSCQPNVRSPTRAAWTGSGSSSSTQKPSKVATTNPTANSTSARGRLRPSGYEAHSGTSRNGANFVHDARPTKSPRAAAEVERQTPRRG